MKFFMFHLMPWPYLPDDFDQHHKSAWVTCPNTYYDANRGTAVYNNVTWSYKRIAMHLRTFFFTLVLCVLPFCVYGGTLREVELIDGSIIRAEVLSMDGKTYRLRSDALGTIEVPEYQVKAIRSPGESLVRPQTAAEPTFSSSTSPLATSVPTPSANDLQQALSQNPAAMNKIISLQNDPLMQQILGDENTMRAVQAGDLGALMNDPKVRALMNHPTVRELSGQYGQ